MALIGQGVNPVAIDFSAIGNDAWRTAASNVSAIGGVIDAVKERRDKKDAIKTSRELAKAMATLYPESAGALEPVIAQLDDEETPLSQRAALGAQIGSFIEMGVQKSRDNALMNLQVQQLGLDERRVRIAEAMPQMEAAAAQSQALSENDIQLDKAIAKGIATVDAAKMAGVDLPSETTNLLNKYLEEGNGAGALAAAEAQASAIDKFIKPAGGLTLTELPDVDATGQPINRSVFVSPEGDILDLNRQPLNQIAPVDGTVLPPRDDVPAEPQRRIPPMPTTGLGIRPVTPAQTPTQAAIEEAKLAKLQGDIAAQGAELRKDTDLKTAAAENANSTIAIIDQLVGNKAKGIKEHPGFKAAVGQGLGKAVSSVPLVGPYLAPETGTARADAKGIIEQLKGRTFLDKVQALRGLGPLSDAEGARIQAAAARLNPDGSEAGFRAAVAELRRDLEKLAQTAQQEAGKAPAPASTATDRLKAAKARLGQ